MMNRLAFLSLIIASLFCVFTSCSSGDNHKKNIADEDSGQNKSEIRGSQKNIIIYGSDHCVHCQIFRRKLESKGIEYTFLDVDKNDNYFLELQEKIRESGFTGYVQYPVIDIEGQILVQPEFPEAEKLMFNVKDN